MSQVRWPPIKPDRGDHDASKGRIRTTGTIPGPSDSLDCQVLKQRLRVLQVARVEPFVEPPVKPEQPVRALAAPCAGHARGARGPIRRAWRPTESRRWLPIPSQASGGVPADTNNRHCRDRPQRGAGEREPMRSQSLRRWQQSGALYSNRLFLPTKATNAGISPSGGILLARLCLKSDGVMIGFWTCKPRLSVDRSRARRAHHLVL